MANTIENTVTFSGSDIEVIAYRGNRTPASTFALEELERERRDLVKESNVLNKQAYELAKQSQAAQGLADQADKQLQRELEASLDLTSGGGLTPGSHVDPFLSPNGAYQNYRSFSNDARRFDSEAQGLKAQREGILFKENDISERIDKLFKIPFFKLGTIHTVSYSSFREKFAVRTLARVQANGYTRGPRTIAGTMVFNMFQEHEFLKLFDDIDKYNTIDPRAVMIDQLQPFNLLFIFANEYGAYSSLHLLNVDISSEGQEMSIDQIITHNTMNFYSTDMIPMVSLGNSFSSYDDMVNSEVSRLGGGGVESSTKKTFSNIDGLINPFSDVDEVSNLLSESRGLF